MQETELTNEDENMQIFSAALEMENIPKINETFLYRYMNKEGYVSTLNNNSDTLKVRFSEYTNFEDKNEGIIIKKYYEEALLQLVREKTISKEQYESFKIIDIPDDQMYLYRGDKIDRIENKKSEVYILCLSKKANNQQLIDNGNNYCFKYITPSNEILIELAKDGEEYKIMPIIYGENSINYLKCRIIETLKEINKVKDIDIQKDFIKDILRDLRYAFKEEKDEYIKEDEVRIVLYTTPNNKKIYSLNGKKYIDLELPKSYLRESIIYGD